MPPVTGWRCWRGDSSCRHDGGPGAGAGLRPALPAAAQPRLLHLGGGQPVLDRGAHCGTGEGSQLYGVLMVAVKSHFTAIFSSSQQEQWQCGAQLINQQQQIIIITCSCCSQETAVSACMQLRSAVLRDHAAGHLPAGSVPAGPSHDTTRVTLAANILH